MDGQTLSLKNYNSDTRFVVKRGRSLAEGSPALGRLLAGGQRVAPQAARKRKF